MLPSIPYLLLVLLLASPALLTPSKELQLGGQRTPRDTKQDSIKVVISEGCATPGDSPDGSQAGKEIDLAPGSPLVLTHKIKLVPSDSASGSGSCGCDADFAPLRERLERLEREVSALRETCAGTEESCCTSKESKGAGCSIKPETNECPSDCSDQGRCVDGKCVCFSGFTGPDCSQSSCPGNCSNGGKCVNGQCVCDPGFIGPDCSQRACPSDCNDRGRCVNGRCVCDSGFTGADCSEAACPGNCNKRGRCANGECVCNLGFTGPDCSQRACPDNCNNQGRCVKGKCVCESGFTGPSCLDKSCPGNCNKRGRCVNGQCVCNPGFTGQDCSQRACPSDCNNQGRCVNGRCVCDTGFTGPSCSDESCPGNCNRRGRCVNGQCVCKPGFTGLDCSKRACPDNCNNRGRCVNGKCVCNSGFAGADCSEAACPGNCNNRGRCVNGQCLCDDGFTGEDCTEKTCPNDCSDRGRCVSGECICDSGFIGNDCSEKACPENCNNRGRCVEGQCVCDDGFTGADCSEKACPENCNNRGRCVEGQCLCDDGFTGADCSEAGCPNNCNNRGRCVSGQCVCDDGFTGEDCTEKTCPNDCSDRGRCVSGECICDSGFIGNDCSEKACPNNCNNRGRCVDGQCVCDDGFTGADCSEKACPKNCSNRGKCVNGKCACDVGFMGPDCSAKGCPNNCNNRGRCVRGSCVCRRGFKGPDCSQCQERMTGPNCDVVMSAVSQLSTQNVTETSVAVVWTPPPVQYETYHITFSSQKETDQQITTQVDGRLTTFTQTGLAAGQDYRVSIVGEIDGRRGAESTTEFTTLISGPTKLQVVKMSSTSAVVQWEPSVGEIDRYRLTVTPNDGAGSQEMTIPADQNSAHIQQLEAGHLYEIQLVAEKGMSRSAPETIQAVPGMTISSALSVRAYYDDVNNPSVHSLYIFRKDITKISTVTSSPSISKESTLTVPATLTPNQVVGGTHQDLNPSAEGQIFDQNGKTEDVSKANSDVSSAAITARTKPLYNKMFSINGTRSRLTGRTIPSRKPKVPFRVNATRVPGGRNFVPGSLRKVPMVPNKKKQIVPRKSKPGAPIIRESMTDSSVDTSSSDQVDKNPAILSGTDSEKKSHSGSEESAADVDLKEQPDVGIVGHGNYMDLVSPEPTGAVQNQEKKCINKIKVAHSRLPLKDRGNGCRGDVAGLVKNTLSPDLGSPPSGEPDVDYTPDPLQKLLKDTFESMNITTFSVHLSKPSNLTVSAKTVSNLILRGLKPLPSLPSSSASSQSQPSTRSSASEASRSPAAAPSPLPSPLSSPSSPSPGSDASTAAPSSSQTYLIPSLPSSLPPSPQSISLSPPTTSPTSSSDKFDSLLSNELGKSSKGIIDSTPSKDRKVTPSREGGVPHLRPPKHGYIRRPHPRFGPFQSKTPLNLRFPPRSPPRLSPELRTESTHVSTSELLPSPSTSASEQSPSVVVNAPVNDTSEFKSRAATPELSGVEQNQNKILIERGGIPNRRLPPKSGYQRRPFPNRRPFQVRTHPIMRPLTPPVQPLNPEIEINKEKVFSNELTATSSPSISKEFTPSDSGPVKGTDEGSVGISSTSMPAEFSQTFRGSGVPLSRRPNTKIGYFRRVRYDGNRSQVNPRLRQYLVYKSFPTRKINAGSRFIAGNQTGQLGKDRISENQLAKQNVHHPTQEIPIREGDREPVEIPPINQIDGNTTVRPQIENLVSGDKAVIKGEEISSTDSVLQGEKETEDPGKNSAATIPRTPTTLNSPNSRVSSPATFPKRQPPARTVTAPQHTQMRHYTTGSQKGENPKTSHASRRVFNRKSEQTSPTSDVSSSGVLREPLDFVQITNRTSDGLTLIWDSPEGKYKNFVVTRKEARKEEDTKQEKEQEREDSDKDGGGEEEEENHVPDRGTISENLGVEDENRVPESLVSHAPSIQSSAIVKPTENEKTFKKVVPGPDRFFRFEDLHPQTEYTLTLLGKGPGVLSRLHKLVISTGPEPPSNIVFSKVTENSVTVSWTKPKSSVSGFKVTYTHADEGEPVSVSLDSKDSSVALSELSPGSSYEVTIISTLGLDESDPVKDFVMTLPDPPTHLRAVNVTDSSALLLWRPALAAVDKYSIVYGEGTGSEVRVTVSGNAAEQQLTGLEGSTTYTVTVTSQLGGRESSPASATFTTTGASGKVGEGPKDLQARDVTPRTAMLSWKPPSKPVSNYRLSYQAEGQEMKEVIVDASVTQYNLTRLHPGSTYTVQLWSEGGGHYTPPVSTGFTTGTLRFPFPTDCSQELLNGIRTSGKTEIFPQGRHGLPVMVYCDMETDGGGWTVFQRRKDGSENFFRGWKEYTRGFGDLNGEFWLGLESIHNLTAMTRMSLRVDLRNGDESAFAQYSTFELAKRNYRLTVGGYSGTAGDSLSYHNNRIFSTKDRDLAFFITRCAMSYRGGWWYKNCHEANLNGLYSIHIKHQGVIWNTWKGKDFSIPFTEMKMRPAAFRPPSRA